MSPIKTAPNGVIDSDTIFHFTQHEHIVEASYIGGQILRGCLLGIMEGQNLYFQFCQLHHDFTLRGGFSNCEVSLTADNLIQITENFIWESGGEGQNIIRQTRP